MKNLMWVVAVFAAVAFTGCASVSKYDRVILQVNEQGDVLAAEVEQAKAEKGATPTIISVTLVKDAAGNELYYEIGTDVSKYTRWLWLYTARDVKSGRQLCRIPRGAHGTFRVPVKYFKEYALLHGIFVDPWDFKHPLTGTEFASIPDTVPSSWKGVAVVEEDHSLCFAGVLDEAGRTKHAAHVIGGVIPAVTATRTLPAPAQTSANAVQLTQEQEAALNVRQPGN